MSNWSGPHGWTRLTADGHVGRGETWVFGVLIRVSVTGAQVSLYDGQDTSGRLVAVLEGEADITKAYGFFGGLRLDRGLYVDLGSNVDECLVVWDGSGPP